LRNGPLVLARVLLLLLSPPSRRRHQFFTTTTTTTTPPSPSHICTEQPTNAHSHTQTTTGCAFGSEFLLQNYFPNYSFSSSRSESVAVEHKNVYNLQRVFFSEGNKQNCLTRLCGVAGVCGDRVVNTPGGERERDTPRP